MCRSARLFNCARCRCQVVICSHCDNAHRYCSADCAQLSRREKQREASIRYQLSPKGRLAHASRQQLYRQRQREKVTHQSSPQLSFNDLLLRELKSGNSAPNPTNSIHRLRLNCHFCRNQCSELLRLDFLQRQSKNERSPLLILPL
jgi:hypothetical protein